MEFSDWITKKYTAWRGNAFGHDRSVTGFAEWVGVSQPLMSHWMKKGGKIPSSKDSINKLVEKFGLEVYEVLGFICPKGERKVTHKIELPTQDFRTGHLVAEAIGKDQDKSLTTVSRWHVIDNKSDVVYEVYDHGKTTVFEDFLSAINYYNSL